MAFQTGLSGLNVAAADLDVIGNNVANASTVGFKSSRAEFADVYAASLSGGGGSQIGLGSRVAAVGQRFTQGNLTATNNPLDVAINGKGFFRVSDSGSIAYTRNGQFHLDSDGYVVTTDGLQLTGYAADVSGNIVLSTPVPLQVSASQLAPSPTSKFLADLNLDSRTPPPTTAIFSPADPTSFSQSTSGAVYDTLGNPHVFTLYFVKTAVNGQWDLRGSVDGTPLANVNLGAGAGNPVSLTFNSSGALTSATPVVTSLAVAGGAVTPLTFDLNLTGSTQFGSDFGINSLSQDGFTSGRLAGINVGSEGIVVGNYTNGQTKNLGQIALSTFANPQGLKPIGNNRWEESADSGLAITGTPGNGNFGPLQSAAVEESNVDLTAELVRMITAQRVYQANAQTIKTQDAMLQTLVNLR
ncbi:MAG: flagellar hook protein FlgE [Burkholderiales bacterium]